MFFFIHASRDVSSIIAVVVLGAVWPCAVVLSTYLVSHRALLCHICVECRSYEHQHPLKLNESSRRAIDYLTLGQACQTEGGPSVVLPFRLSCEQPIWPSAMSNLLEHQHSIPSRSTRELASLGQSVSSEPDRYP